MSDYLDRPDDLAHDTKNFLKSEYGKHIVSTLESMKDGYLSKASNVELPYPERYAAKYSAIKEVMDLINSPIG
jgi:hypothetical protein